PSKPRLKIGRYSLEARESSSPAVADRLLACRRAHAVAKCTSPSINHKRSCALVYPVISPLTDNSPLHIIRLAGGYNAKENAGDVAGRPCGRVRPVERRVCSSSAGCTAELEELSGRDQENGRARPEGRGAREAEPGA